METTLKLLRGLLNERLDTYARMYPERAAELMSEWSNQLDGRIRLHDRHHETNDVPMEGDRKIKFVEEIDRIGFNVRMDGIRQLRDRGQTRESYHRMMAHHYGFLPTDWKLFYRIWKTATERDWKRWMRIYRHEDFDVGLHGWMMLRKKYRGTRSIAEMLDEMERTVDPVEDIGPQMRKRDEKDGASDIRAFAELLDTGPMKDWLYEI